MRNISFPLQRASWLVSKLNVSMSIEAQTLCNTHTHTHTWSKPFQKLPDVVATKSEPAAAAEAAPLRLAQVLLLICTPGQNIQSSNWTNGGHEATLETRQGHVLLLEGWRLEAGSGSFKATETHRRPSFATLTSWGTFGVSWTIGRERESQNGSTEDCVE